MIHLSICLCTYIRNVKGRLISHTPIQSVISPYPRVPTGQSSRLGPTIQTVPTGMPPNMMSGTYLLYIIYVYE
jgi:hypothetical protein